MDYKELVKQIRTKKSFLCVGLDTDLQKIPGHLQNKPNALFEFNKAIVDATAQYCVAYKPNLAFYEAHGLQGWESLAKTVEYIRHHHPNMFLIADAKRGDIGNTATMYARAFFETMDFDAITVAPYMGFDSVKPFIGFKNKWVIVLGLTSNAGAADFQYIPDNNGTPLFMNVIEKSVHWGNQENMMYVVGATKAENLDQIRDAVPNHFLLVPGIGAQGGSLEEVVKYGMTCDINLLVNASRSIIYASDGNDFASAAEKSAHSLQQQMAAFI